MDDASEFAAVAITEDKLVSWPRIAAVAAMVAFSLPTFITGLEVYHAMSPIAAMWALLVGSLIIFTIGAVMGAIGAKTHMSSYLLVRIAFGDVGAGIVNVAFAISLIGWFGININLFADAADRLSAETLGFTLHPYIWMTIASICMTMTTLIGFKAINMLATAMVPVLAIVTALLIYSALKTQSLQDFFEGQNVETLTFGEGVTAVVGAIIIGAIILPDITRFARHWSGAIYTAFIGYVIVQLAVMGAAALAGGSTGKIEILGVMLDLGLGLGAFLIVIAGSWVLNSLNLYSAVLSTKATFPKLNTLALTLALGAIGILAAMMNILDYFITFLIYLSVVFVPVAGIIIVDFAMNWRTRYRIETLAANRKISVKAFAAWIVGAVISILMENDIFPSLTSMGAVDSAILSGVVYGCFAWIEHLINDKQDQTV